MLEENEKTSVQKENRNVQNKNPMEEQLSRSIKKLKTTGKLEIFSIQKEKSYINSPNLQGIKQKSA
ncbi:hypothetical protein CAPN004_05560 [Capnocytophaga cynodegmi]|nr:hypothetical protein CAPN004_05560 [Capnocytophaga cynodegmi]